jgi:hypothetical protein
MMAQLPPGSYGSAVWLIHNTVLGALFTLNSSGFPYLPAVRRGPGPARQEPVRLAPRPSGDRVAARRGVQLRRRRAAARLQYYQTITKGGVQTATSMHLYFDADAMAFRLTFRIDGKPKIAAAISQAQGSTKLSPFLKLQAR